MNAQLIYKLLDQINKYGTRIESDMVSENLKLIGEIYALAGAVVPCDAYTLSVPGTDFFGDQKITYCYSMVDL